MQALPHDEPPAITDAPDWTEGDFELISSDNVRFRVATYHLQSSSTVFRDMIAVGGDNEKCVRFTSDFECSNVLYGFLDLIVDGIKALSFELSHECPNTLLRNHVQLLNFLLKYDCQAAKQALLLDVSLNMHQGFATPTFAFTSGAIADDSHLCNQAIVLANRYANGIPHWFMWKAHRYTMGPSDFGIASWSVIPPAYQWALCKMCDTHGIGKGCDADLTNTFRAALHEAQQHERAEAGQVARE